MSDDTEFIVVMDVLETLTYKYGINTVKTNHTLQSEIRKLEMNFMTALPSMIDDDLTLKRISVDYLSQKFMGKVKPNKDSFLVCLDKAYFPGAFHIEVTRDDSNHVVNRYGSPSLDDQADALKTSLENSLTLRNSQKDLSVILFDVGISEGDTVNKVAKLLYERGIPIKCIISGITSKVGLKNLSCSPYVNCEVISTETSNWRTWVDERDLFLIDGRQPPRSFLQNSIRRFIPYTEQLAQNPYSSIRKERKEDLKNLCHKTNTSLIGLLESYNVDTKPIGEFISLKQVRSPRIKI